MPSKEEDFRALQKLVVESKSNGCNRALVELQHQLEWYKNRMIWFESLYKGKVKSS